MNVRPLVNGTGSVWCFFAYSLGDDDDDFIPFPLVMMMMETTTIIFCNSGSICVCFLWNSGSIYGMSCIFVYIFLELRFASASMNAKDSKIMQKC